MGKITITFSRDRVKWTPKLRVFAQAAGMRKDTTSKQARGVRAKFGNMPTKQYLEMRKQAQLPQG